MPKSLSEFGHGLAKGTGDVVEGLADIPGIALDPINTLVGRALGYDGYNADFGKTVRETLGLPEDNSISGDLIKGASSGLGTAGVARLLAKAGTGATAAALRDLGSTPLHDAASGAGGAVGADLARDAGLPVPVQVAAALAGGATGALGIQRAGASAAKVLDSSAAERLAPQLAQRRFEARQALNKYRAVDRDISADVQNIVQAVQESSVKPGARKLTKAQQADLIDRVSTLEASYLPYDDLKAATLPASAKAKLTTALDNRHLLGEDAINALQDGSVAGDAVADAIRKTRRLRALIPEAAGQSNRAAGRFLVEALGTSIGGKLGGPVGSVIGSAAAKSLTRSQASSAAEKAAEIARQANKFAAMPAETFGESIKPGQALSDLASEALDAPAVARQEADRLEAEGRKVGIANDRDNVRPGGGWRGLIYDRTGLLPADQDAGALAALKDGHITPDQFQAFLDAPDRLMAGNAGNALTDRLASMADSGRLSRDPQWQPKEPEAPSSASPMLDAQGQPIRSLPAYQAGAAKNIARHLPLLQELDAIKVERAARYDSDPEFAKIAGTDADPYVARMKAIQDTLASNRKGGEASR
jgi:hypothetical protein